MRTPKPARIKDIVEPGTEGYQLPDRDVAAVQQALHSLARSQHEAAEEARKNTQAMHANPFLLPAAQLEALDPASLQEWLRTQGVTSTAELDPEDDEAMQDIRHRIETAKANRDGKTMSISILPDVAGWKRTAEMFQESGDHYARVAEQLNDVDGLIVITMG